MIIYIAGPMKGIENSNREAFYGAEILLTDAGHDVLNPAVLPDGLPDTAYMPICMAMLNQADAIYLLNGWKKSVGARAERLFAKRQGKLELFEGDVKMIMMREEENK